MRIYFLLAASFLANTVHSTDVFLETGESSKKSGKIAMETYQTLLETVTPPDVTCFITARREVYPDIFKTLEMSVSQEEMLKMHHQYNVIINRKPQQKELIIGCGNLSLNVPNICVPYIDTYNGQDATYRPKHQHSNQDTIDLDFARNPTIVGDFCTLNPASFQGHLYHKIATEGVMLLLVDYFPLNYGVLVNDDEKQKHSLNAMRNVIQLLADDGFYETHQGSHFTKSQLEALLKEVSSSEDAFSVYLKQFDNTLETDIPLCNSMEEFMSRYHVTLQDILAAMKMSQSLFLSELEDYGWQNLEAYSLPREFKKKCYNL